MKLLTGLNGKDIYFIFIVATIPIKEYTYIGLIESFGGKSWIT